MRPATVAAQDKGVITLSTGVRARIRPVSATLLDEVSQMVPAPEVPRQFIEAKGREESNPLDPIYQQAVKDADRQRGLKTTEALIMFGIELVDGMPPEEEWLPKLIYMQKRGLLDLTKFDLDDPMEVELVYKLYVAVSGADLMYVSMASGLTEKEVAEAMTSFQRKTPRRTHPAGGNTGQA
jgi:hypothetical protein